MLDTRFTVPLLVLVLSVASLNGCTSAVAPAPSGPQIISSDKQIWIELRESHSTAEGWRSLQGLPVTRLALQGKEITNQELAALQGLPLQVLDLSQTWATGKGLECLEGLPLSTLRLTGELMAPEDLAALKRLTVTELELRNGELTDSACKEIAASHVEKLLLREVAVSAEGLQLLQGMRITDLTLEGAFTDAHIEAIRPLPLTSLTLIDTQVTAKGLHAFNGSRLTELHLRGNITQEQLTAIRGLTLKKLSLHYPEEVKIDLKALQGSTITDLALHGEITQETIWSLYGMTLATIRLENRGYNLEEISQVLHRLQASRITVNVSTPISQDKLAALHGLPISELVFVGRIQAGKSSYVFATLPLETLLFGSSIDRLGRLDESEARLRSWKYPDFRVNQFDVSDRGLEGLPYSPSTQRILNKLKDLPITEVQFRGDESSETTAIPSKTYSLVGLRLATEGKSAKEIGYLARVPITQLTLGGTVKEQELEALDGMSLSLFHLIGEDMTDQELKCIRGVAERNGIVLAPRRPIKIPSALIPFAVLAPVGAGVFMFIRWLRRRKALMKDEPQPEV